MCSVPRLSAGHHGEHDLIDRLDPMPAPKRRLNRKRVYAGEAVAARLYPGDAVKIRALKRSAGVPMSKFVRDAVRAALEQAGA